MEGVCGGGGRTKDPRPPPRILCKAREVIESVFHGKTEGRLSCFLPWLESHVVPAVRQSKVHASAGVIGCLLGGFFLCRFISISCQSCIVVIFGLSRCFSASIVVRAWLILILFALRRRSFCAACG